MAQCGNFKIFLSLRLYVKLSAKTAAFAILGAVNFVHLQIVVNFSLQKIIKIKIQNL